MSVFFISMYNYFFFKNQSLKTMFKNQLFKNLFIILNILIISSCGAAPDNAGKVSVQSDKPSALVYVNGKKKGMTGDDGWMSLLLAEGEYKIKVEKNSDDGEWLYTKTRSLFLGADSSIKLNFKLNKILTEKGTAIREEIALDLKNKRKREKLARFKEFEKEKARAAKRYKKQLVLDKKNGTVVVKTLMWKRCSEGQNWTGKICDGKAKGYSWHEADELAKSSNYAEHSHWRLPTLKELNVFSYSFKSTLFPNTPQDTFWTSSSYDHSPNYAWIVDFDTDKEDGAKRSEKIRVRFVRSY